MPAIGSQHDDTHLWIIIGLLQQRDQTLAIIRRNGIGGIGLVERDPHDAIRKIGQHSLSLGFAQRIYPV